MKAPVPRRLFEGRYIFHVLFWIMYAVFTILESQGYIIRKGVLFSLMPLSVFFTLMALLMLVNNRLLIPQLLEKRKTLLYMLGIIACVICYTYFRSLNQLYWDNIVWPEDKMSIQSYFLWNFLYAIWFIIISSLLYFTQKWTDHRQRQKSIQITELQAELKYLRSQLNPHFLFNGLNTIYGYIDMENAEARTTLLQFSDLLRYHLYDADVEWTTLDKEATYLRNYVSLQQARSNTSRKISLTIHIENPETPTAPLLFLAFVENAFKFSGRDDGRESFVTVSLTQEAGTITFSCSNSFEEPVPESGGIGLSNVRRRLELLYPGRHELQITRENGVYSVRLILNA